MQYKVMYWNIQYYLLWSMQNFTNALLYDLLHSTMLYNFNLSNDRSHVIFLPLLIPLLFLFISPVAYNSSISLEAHTHRMLDGSHIYYDTSFVYPCGCLFRTFVSIIKHILLFSNAILSHITLRSMYIILLLYRLYCSSVAWL
jgi:hypothetical protein